MTRTSLSYALSNISDDDQSWASIAMSNCKKLRCSQSDWVASAADPNMTHGQQEAQSGSALLDCSTAPLSRQDRRHHGHSPLY